MEDITVGLEENKMDKTFCIVTTVLKVSPLTNKGFNNARLGRHNLRGKNTHVLSKGTKAEKRESL